MHCLIVCIVGLGLAIYGIHSAILNAYPFWYSFFVIGSFLLFDQTDKLLNKDSTLFSLLKGKWHIFLFSYLTYLFFGLFIDLVLGRYLGNMWLYPHFDLIDKIIHVILIGYPFAFFSVASLYRSLYGISVKLLPLISKDKKINIWKKRIAKLLLFFTVLSISIPIINFYFFNNQNVHKLMVICMIIGIFSLSPITFLLYPKSFLKSILLPDYRAIVSLFLTSILCAFLHEVPNTYAWEWRYQNIPFISYEILGVNIIVLTFGWFFLTILSISVNDLLFQITNNKEGYNDFKNNTKDSG